jgi:hypothetical protein
VWRDQLAHNVWEESNVHLTGIPPHVKGLVDFHALKFEQAQLAGTIYDKVKSGMTEYFEARKIGGGDMTEARIKDMTTSACQQNVEHLVEHFEEKLKSLADTFEQSVACRPIRERINNPPSQPTFMLQTNPHGEISRLPNNFPSFPKGARTIVGFNVGHIDQKIPPLGSLTPREFQFIDDRTDSEKPCQRGSTKFKEKR